MSEAERPTGRSGTRLVIVFLSMAALVFVALRVYGERFAAFHSASTPMAAVRERILSDNTVVGRMEGIREIALVEVEPVGASGDTVALAAEVTGRGGSGMLFADLARDGRVWRVLRASFRAPDGERLPLEDGPPALDPAP